jgi:hypothetical protein
MARERKVSFPSSRLTFPRCGVKRVGASLPKAPLSVRFRIDPYRQAKVYSETLFLAVMGDELDELMVQLCAWAESAEYGERATQACPP